MVIEKKKGSIVKLKRNFTDQCMMECFELSSSEDKKDDDIMEIIEKDENKQLEKIIREKFSLFFKHYKPLLDEYIKKNTFSWKERCVICSQNNRKCPYFRIKESYLVNGNSQVDDQCQNELCKSYQKQISAIVEKDQIGRMETLLVKNIIKIFDDCKFNVTFGYDNRCRHSEYINNLRNIKNTCSLFDKIKNWYLTILGGGKTFTALNNQEFLDALAKRINDIENTEEKEKFIQKISDITKEAKEELEKIKNQGELTKIPRIIEGFISDMGKIKFFIDLKCSADKILDS